MQSQRSTTEATHREIMNNSRAARVLVVDERERENYVLSRMLREDGFEVVCAFSGGGGVRRGGEASRVDLDERASAGCECI
jgi:PleD family two-component response regulator